MSDAAGQAPPRQLVLASTSPRRRELLGRLGLAFSRLDPAVDEPPPAPGADAREYTLAMARLKADAAQRLVLAGAADVPPECSIVDVLASDTTVALGSQILGKPRDEADARRILTALSGSRHTVLSSVCLLTLDVAAGTLLDRAEAVEETHIQFRDVRLEEIAAYVASGEAIGKAGAYAVQESGDRFVERIDGHFTTVVGLPLRVVAELLRARGYAVPPPAALDVLDRRLP